MSCLLSFLHGIIFAVIQDNTSVLKKLNRPMSTFEPDAVRVRNARRPQYQYIHSPDHLCAIHLGAVRNLWFFQALPVISNRAQLMTSEWRDYLHAVYGHLDSEESYPIDLRCFTHWWHNLLPVGQRSLFERHYRPGGLANATRGSLVDYSGIGPKKGSVAWQLYLLDDADVTSAMNGVMGSYKHQVTAVSIDTGKRRVELKPIALEPSYNLTSLWQHDYKRFTIRGPVPSHTWIEVYHDYNDRTHATKQKGGLTPNVGWWAHFAPGSGVWANVGRTIIVGAGGYCTKLHVRPLQSSPTVLLKRAIIAVLLLTTYCPSLHWT